MKRKCLVSIFLVLVASFTLYRGAISKQLNEAEAINAAEAFLSCLDRGAFDAA